MNSIWPIQPNMPLPEFQKNRSYNPVRKGLKGAEVPFTPSVPELQGMDPEDDLEPWEEAPTEKLELPRVSPVGSSQVYAHDPLTLPPAARARGFNLGVEHAASGSGCIIPLLLGVLTLPILVWLVQVCLGGRLPAYMTWWLVEKSR